jgi:flagellar motility protein MotE (MotC chaperone)
MAKKKTTTTPTNKLETASNVVALKKATKKGSKGLDVLAPKSAPSEGESKPLQSTIGEALAAKGAKPVHEVQVINFDRRLPCPLNSAQLTDRAKRMKELRRTVKQNEALLTSEKEEWDKRKKSIESDISKASSEINDLADEIGDEAEYRDVRCQRVFDYQLMEVREVRTDTTPPKQLQEPRAMTAREVEEGYTNNDGERQPATAEQEKPNVTDDSIPFGDESTDDSGDIDFD